MSVNIYKKETDTLQKVAGNAEPINVWTGTSAEYEAEKDTIPDGSYVNIIDDIDTYELNFPDGTGFYPDIKDGVRGYNTSESRGADTFFPFKSGGGGGSTGSYLTNVLPIEVSDSGRKAVFDIKSLYPEYESIDANNIFIEWTKYFDSGAINAGVTIFLTYDKTFGQITVYACSKWNGTQTSPLAPFKASIPFNFIIVPMENMDITMARELSGNNTSGTFDLKFYYKDYDKITVNNIHIIMPSHYYNGAQNTTVTISKSYNPSTGVITVTSSAGGPFYGEHISGLQIIIIK